MPRKPPKPTGWQPVPRMGESPMPRERHVAFCVLDKRRLRGSVRGMTLMEIKTEVLPKLTLEEKAELARMLADDETVAGANGDPWDAQIREDARAGRLDFLIEEAATEYARGETEACP